MTVIDRWILAHLTVERVVNTIVLIGADIEIIAAHDIVFVGTESFEIVLQHLSLASMSTGAARCGKRLERTE